MLVALPSLCLGPCPNAAAAASRIMAERIALFIIGTPFGFLLLIDFLGFPAATVQLPSKYGCNTVIVESCLIDCRSVPLCYAVETFGRRVASRQRTRNDRQHLSANGEQSFEAPARRRLLDR